MSDSRPFPTLDDLKAAHDLENRGQDRGRDGEPPATQAGLDPVETEVFEQCNTYYSGLLDEHRRKERAFDETLRRRKVSPSQLEADADQACTALRKAYDAHQSNLHERVREAREAREELNRFKEENELSRQPHVPEHTGLAWAILAAIVLVETLINGFFFGEQLAGGTVAGVTQAVLISLGNVLVIGLLGKLVVGRIVHRLSAQRFVGWAGLFLVLLPLAVVFNLGVAHYRDALPEEYPSAEAECYHANEDGVSGPEEADLEALCLLRTSTFLLSGFKSYLLLFIGLAMCAIAIWEWAYHMTDPYPGYGKRGRDWLQKKKWLDDAKEELLDELDAGHDEAVAHQNASFEDPVARRERLIAAHRDLRAAVEQVGTRRDDLEVNCQGAIQVYRSANVAARPEKLREAIPNHWRQPWEASWSAPEPPPAYDWGTEEEAEEEKEQATQALRARLKRLDEFCDEMKRDLSRATRLRA